VPNPQGNYKTVRENQFSLSVRTVKEKWITVMPNKFLDGLNPTGYTNIYPDGRRTINEI
jgi:hypothetical protein